MAQTASRKPRWRRRVVLACLCVLLAWCAVPGEKPPALLGMHINGNPMIVPVSYIPFYERGWYGQGLVTKGLHISAEWNDGAMQPFVSPENNTPVWFTYHDHYGILLRNIPNETYEARRKLATFFASLSLPNRIPDDSRHGLMRFVHKGLAQREQEDSMLTLTERDLYLYPSRQQIETLILCDPDFFPNPYTERAYALEKRGKFVIIPMCSHEMFMHDLSNTQIKIIYYRAHLPRWREIEEAVRELLKTFQPLPGALHYELENRMSAYPDDDSKAGLVGAVELAPRGMKPFCCYREAVSTVSADYALPSAEGQLQTEHPDKHESGEPHAQQ